LKGKAAERGSQTIVHFGTLVRGVGEANGMSFGKIKSQVLKKKKKLRGGHLTCT